MQKRSRRVNVTLLGDNAALWDIYLTQLGIDEKGRSKAVADQKLMELALAALDAQIREIGKESSVRFPDYALVAKKLGITPVEHEQHAKTAKIPEEGAGPELV